MYLLNNWIALAILAGLSSNAFNFFNRYFLKDKDDPIMYGWFVETTKCIFFVLFAFFDWKLVINLKSIIIFLSMGISETIAVILYMKMHSYAQLSISTILSRTRLIWVAILAFFILGESLKTPEYIGIVIIFFGLSTVVAPKKLFIDKGAIYSNLSAFMIALTLVLMKMALPYGSNAVVNMIVVIPAILILPFLIRDFRKKLSIVTHDNFVLKIFAVFLNVMNLYILTVALRIGDSGRVIAIYQGMLVVSVLAGIVFLKERANISRKLIGTAVTVIGVLLLTT